MSQIVLQVIPAVPLLVAKCPFCGETNSALIKNGEANLSKIHCEHAVTAGASPPEISFSETGE